MIRDGSDARVNVREAALPDVETIVAFNTAMALETESKQLDLEVLRAGVQRALTDPALCHYFVADVDGEIAGQTMVTFEWSDWRNGLFWWIQSVYVERRFRRRGVFRALHDHVRTLAKAKGAIGLRLYVEKANRGAQETYARLGMPTTDYYICEETW